MKPTKLLILSLAFAATATPLSAQPGELFKGRKILTQKVEAAGEFLELTEEQKAEIKSILKGYKSDIQQQMTAGRAARSKMESAVREHGPESENAEKAAAYVGEVAASRALLMGEILTDLSDVLTEEQMAKIGDFKAMVGQLVENRLSAAGL